MLTPTPELLADLVVTAFEGGSNYWCRTAVSAKPTTGTDLWYASLEFYADPGWEIIITPGDNPLNQTTATEALLMMHDNYPRHYSDVVTDNMDADTADVFLQCAVFGDVVYG